MSDLLVDLGQNPYIKQAIKQLGLPLPMPEKLRRPRGAWEERPLDGRTVVVFACGQLTVPLAAILAQAGAFAKVVGTSLQAAPFVAPGEAFGRRVVQLEADAEPPADLRADALVFDASSLSMPRELRGLYDAFHPYIGALNRGGRVLVIGRPASASRTASEAATSAALDGFVRSLAKEVGRKGATAHTVFVEPGAGERLPPLVRFLLSDRSSFLTGQPWTVDARVESKLDAKFVRPLEGKTALVTGAARGIGASIAQALAAEGAKVVCLDRPGDEAPLAQVAQAIGGAAIALDITERDASVKLIDYLDTKCGPLDILIHNAGITRDKTLGRMSASHWDQALAVNLDAVVDLTEALLAHGLSDNARIVCLSSVSGLAGNVGQSNYSASKAGVVGYVKALSQTIAQRGMTINAIAPGFIETRLTAAMPAVTREVARRLSALGQGGLPKDIAELVTFLSSPGASGLTGQCQRACGGMFIGA